MREEEFCPVFNGMCLERRCALWDGDVCALYTAAAALANIADLLKHRNA